MKRPKIIAHRGGREWAPENTMAAFRNALDFGCDGIELDIQRCASGELIVFHDEELSRTTNGAGLVKDCTLDELKRLSAGLWFDKTFREERVPLLSEVLELIAGKLQLNIELKNAPIAYPGIEVDLMDAIAGYPKDKLLISSFDHQLLAKVHALDEQLPIALLAEAVFLDLKQTATAVGATYYHPPYDAVRPDVIETAHSAGLVVNAWSMNTPQRWREGIRQGLDGIVTDDPEGLADYLNAFVERN